MEKETVKNNFSYTPPSGDNEAVLGHLEGVCADIINPTRNGRKYSEELWEKVFNDPLVKEQFEAGGIIGELNHPADREETDLTQAAICMPEPPKKNEKGQLIGKWDILNTPNGKILDCLCRYGYKIGISSRGSGETYTDENGNESVDPDQYNFQAFDAVLIPAVKTARLSLVNESFTKNANNNLRVALNEAYQSANDEDKKVMKETLSRLNIQYTPERVNIEANADDSLAANDVGANVLQDLQEALKANRELQKKVNELQEKLSVCYAKEDKYNKSITKLQESVNSATTSLNEQLNTANAKVKELTDLSEKLKKQQKESNHDMKLLDEMIEQRDNTISENEGTIKRLEKLAESLKTQRDDAVSSKEEIKKDATIKRTEYTSKISKLTEQVEKYKKVATIAVDKYISTQAKYLGVNSEDIKRRLPENYSFADIDRICEGYRKTGVDSTPQIPFPKREQKSKVSVQMTETLKSGKQMQIVDDIVDDDLLGVAGI